MRFYDVDGNEIEVQEPKFFIDEEKIKELKKYLEEILNNYV